MEERVFYEWKDPPLVEVLYQCSELPEDTNNPTRRRCREKGGKISGHLQVYRPEENVQAAGKITLEFHSAAKEINPPIPHHDDGKHLC